MKIQDFEVGKEYVDEFGNKYRIDGKETYEVCFKSCDNWEEMTLMKSYLELEYENKPKLLKDIEDSDTFYFLNMNGSISKEVDYYTKNMIEFVNSNAIRITEKSAEKEVLFQQYLAKLYMACEEDSYNEPEVINKGYAVMYDYDEKSITYDLFECSQVPKRYLFNTDESVLKFINENEKFIKKVFE